MSIKQSGWLPCTIAKDGQESAEVNLGGEFKKLVVRIPVIDSAAVSVRVAEKSGGTFNPFHVIKPYTTATPSAGLTSLLQATTAGVGSIVVEFEIGCAQFIKLYAGAAQSTAAVVFYVKGVN